MRWLIGLPKLLLYLQTVCNHSTSLLKRFAIATYYIGKGQVLPVVGPLDSVVRRKYEVFRFLVELGSRISVDISKI